MRTAFASHTSSAVPGNGAPAHAVACHTAHARDTGTPGSLVSFDASAQLALTMFAAHTRHALQLLSACKNTIARKTLLTYARSAQRQLSIRKDALARETCFVFARRLQKRLSVRENVLARRASITYPTRAKHATRPANTRAIRV